jgi:hypothetical protein
MAGTVLSMAKSTMGSVISKAAAAAAEEMSLMIGVQKEMWYVCTVTNLSVSYLTIGNRRYSFCNTYDNPHKAY